MLFITQREVVDLAFSPLDGLTPTGIRLSKIAVAQERFIRPPLGENFYDQLNDAVYVDFLKQYIKPALAHYVRYELISELALRVGDDGVVQLNSTSIDGERLLNRSENANRNDETTDSSNTTIKDSETGNQSSLTNDLHEITKKITVLDSSVEHRDDNKDVQRSSEMTGTTEDRNQFDGANTSQTVTLITGKDKETTQMQEGTSTTVDIKITDNVTTNDTTSDNRQGDSNITTDKTLDRTSKLTGTRSVVGLTQREVEDSDNRTEKHVQRRGATTAQCRMLAHRALSDANVLMRCAVRYVESHPELFPDYFPPVERMRPAIF